MRIEMHKECTTFKEAAEAIMWLQELLGLTTIKDIANGVSINVEITNQVNETPEQYGRND